MARKTSKIEAAVETTVALETATVLTEAPATDYTDAEVFSVLSDWEEEEKKEIADFSEPETPAATEQFTASFDDLVARIDDAEADVLVRCLATEIDMRAEFELSKDPENTNIQRTLKKVRSQLVTKRAAKFSCAAQVSSSFINRSIHGGSCYNVYALGKYADLVNFSVTGQVMNAINNACLRSLFRVLDAGKEFTMETAKMACSANYTAKDGTEIARPHLIRHTVAPSTAPTQASSTMQALVTMGVVLATGSSKNPSYKLTANPITAKFRELLA